MASIRNGMELASLIGASEMAVLSQDDYAKIHIYLSMGTHQTAFLMHL